MRKSVPAMIPVTEHDLREWSRCAQAMYRNGRNAFGHKMSAAAAMVTITPPATYSDVCSLPFKLSIKRL